MLTGNTWHRRNIAYFEGDQSMGRLNVCYPVQFCNWGNSPVSIPMGSYIPKTGKFYKTHFLWGDRKGPLATTALVAINFCILFSFFASCFACQQIMGYIFEPLSK